MALRRDEEPSLHRIRAAARMRIEATSLRRTAREISLSPTGLSGFVSGKAASPATRVKVLSWYARQAWREGRELPPGSASAMVGLLVGHLPEAARPAVAGAVVDVLARATDAHGLPRPAWMPARVGEPEPSGGAAAG
jgi:hypothetical protein